MYFSDSNSIPIKSISFIIKPMRIVHYIKKVIGKCDVFCTAQLLRVHDEPEYKTLTGGICSIALIVMFAAIFLNMIIATITKKNITWSSTTEANGDPLYLQTNTGSNFMFAVSITGVDLSAGERYFDISLVNKVVHNGVTKSTQTVGLSPCTVSQWSSINPSFGSNFNRLKMNQWLCPPPDYEFVFQGKYTSDVFIYSQINVKQCNNATDPTRPCVPNSTLNQFLASNQYFSLSFLLANPIINPSGEDYLGYYLQDRNYITFTPTQGTLMNIFFQQYTIDTDQSTVPILTQMHQQTGAVLMDEGQTINFAVSSNNVYAKIYLRRSQLSTTYTRSFVKIDDAFAYIGGLFSCIILMLFFMKFYTQFAFQIQIGDNLYKYDKQTPLNADGWNIITFFGYVFYSLCKLLHIPLQWQRMKKYDACREEILNQFDVVFLFKRIIFLERAIQIILDDHQFRGLHLHDKLTLKQAQQHREFFHLSKKMKKKPKEKDIKSEETQDKINIGEINCRDRDPTQIIIGRRVFPQDSQSDSSDVQLVKQTGKKLRLLHKESMRNNPISSKIVQGIDNLHFQDIDELQEHSHEFSEREKERDKEREKEREKKKEEKIQINEQLVYVSQNGDMPNCQRSDDFSYIN